MLKRQNDKPPPKVKVKTRNVNINGVLTWLYSWILDSVAYLVFSHAQEVNKQAMSEVISAKIPKRLTFGRLVEQPTSRITTPPPCVVA